MALSYTAPIVFPPRSGKHTSSVIFLHGLGDSGEGWADVGEFELAPRLPNTKLLFPTAPQRSITLNMGMRMNGWYDLKSLDPINENEDEQGLKESLRYVEELIAAEVSAGIPHGKIMVAGFSQGGATALLALRCRYQLAAVLSLSAYLPLRRESIISPENLPTPVLMLHGDADPTVKYKFGVQSFDLLKQAGANVNMKTYRGLHHSINPTELSDMVDFMTQSLT
ncbi:Acyl-protein thioesterase 1 [Coccomyxa sp. Obi]|nr:Acyl-protein thioesterase 1 [Coccomyxa sp. Obi]